MSNPTVEQVRTWVRNAHTLNDAASGIDCKVDTFDNAMNQMTRDVDHVMTDWRGQVARVSQASTDSEKQISNRLAMGILQLTDILQSHGPELEHTSAAAIREIDEVAALGYTVADNGCVTPPAGARGGFPSDIPANATEEQAATLATSNAVQHQGHVQEALRKAGQADESLARKITEAANALDNAADRATTPQAVSPEVQSIIDGHSKLPTDPNLLNHFWSTLSASDKAALWNHNREVGNMDGIPAADRDHFNRRHLVEMQRDTGQRLRDFQDTTRVLTPGNNGFYNSLFSVRDSLKFKMDGLNALDKRLNDNIAPPKFLLVNREDGRAAVALNNPDVSQNICTYVPGTGTNLSTMNSDLNRSEKMLLAAQQANPHKQASVISWADDNAPQSIVPDAAKIARAQNAAAGLDSFQNGIAASHDGPNSAHTTTLGHSYGTTVISAAATDGHILNSSDIVMVASPGMANQADSPSDFNLTGVPSDQTSKHFWSTTSAHDPINIVPEQALGPKPSRGLLFHGAQQFSNDPNGSHSDYWNQGNPALSNMGAIIAGRPDLVN